MKNVITEEWMSDFVFDAVQEQYALSHAIEVDCYEAARQVVHDEESQWHVAISFQEARIHRGIIKGYDQGFRSLACAVSKKQPLHSVLEEFRECIKKLPTSLPPSTTLDEVTTSSLMSERYGQRFALSSMLLQLEKLLIGAVGCRPMPDAMAPESFCLITNQRQPVVG